MKFTAAAAFLALTAASGVSAKFRSLATAPSGTAQLSQYVDTESTLTMSCTQNATDGNTINLFWSTQGFKNVNEVLVFTGDDLDFPDLVKTGGGFGTVNATDFADHDGSVLIAASGVVDPASNTTVTSFCVFNMLSNTTIAAKKANATASAAAISSSKAA